MSIGWTIECDSCQKHVRLTQDNKEDEVLPHGWMALDYRGLRRHYCSRQCIERYLEVPDEPA